MAVVHCCVSLSCIVVILFLGLGSAPVPVDSGVGVNWGIQTTYQPSPKKTVRILKKNNLHQVKLFEAEPQILRALRGSGIQVMVGIPNHMIPLIAYSSAASDAWVEANLTKYDGVDFRYIAVGNEPFLAAYGDQFIHFIYPALQNLQHSLNAVNLAGTVKLVVPCNSDVYQSPPPYYPSTGTFRPDLIDIMTTLLHFLNANGSPFVVNIYPFFSLIGDQNFPQDYAFFSGTDHPLVDGSNVYNNAFDGSLDTLISALTNMGYGNMPISIGEVGWPTDGAVSANLSAAYAFNQGLVNYMLNATGTSLRPGFFGGATPDVYLFSLYDEDQKSTAPGSFERHWGIFSVEGHPKYPLRLGMGEASTGPTQAANRLERLIFTCIVITFIVILF